MSKNLVILGAGESGTGAAVLAKQQGYVVFVSDKGMIKNQYKEELSAAEISWEEGMHSEDKILSASEIVKSPGIPDEAPLIKRLKEKGIPVISEIEFAGRYTQAKLVCITGSNGKTTTTLLTYHILKNAGLNVGLAGNVGQSFARQVALSDKDYYVLELSSFQLDGMFEFKADIAILTNITPDHLDRYDYKLENYVDSKFRILNNQAVGDAFIYNADDPITNQYIGKYPTAAQKYPFSFQTLESEGAYIQNEELIINLNKTITNMSIHDLALQGRHNAYNSMAAGVAARILDVRKEIIRESLSDFQNIEHRLEFVAKVHGIEFINDSKATNVNSTWYALESMQNPTVWIVGGVDKGNDYSALTELVKEKVSGIVCLGKDNAKIHAAFGNLVERIMDANSAQEAVGISYRMAKPGQTVLLSPACASFDLFQSYEDRGNQFKQAVRSL